MSAGDPIAVHWRDEKDRAHATRGLLVAFSGYAVIVEKGDGVRSVVPWGEVSKVRLIT